LGRNSSATTGRYFSIDSIVWNLSSNYFTKISALTKKALSEEAELLIDISKAT
jgi:hypothetical protein